MSARNLIGKGDRNAFGPLKRHGTSEFARLAQSFLEMARRLNARSSFISTFATHVSHELKSPLTSIQGAAELLRDDIDAPAPAMSDAGPPKIPRQYRRRCRPAGENLHPLARFRPRRKPHRGRLGKTVVLDHRFALRLFLRSISTPAASSIPPCAYPRKMPTSFLPILPTTRRGMAARRSISRPRGRAICCG